MPIYNDIPVIGKYLTSDELLSQLSPERAQELQSKYWSRIGLSDKAQFGTEPFANFEKSRMTNIQDFNKTLGPDGEPLLKRLHNNQLINSKLEEVFRPGNNYDSNKAAVTDAITKFVDCLNQIPKKYKTEDLIDSKKAINDRLIKAIEEQQKNEIEQLERLFTEDEFKGELRKAYSSKGSDNTVSPASDKDLEVIKNNMINDLKESHKKQHAEVLKSAGDSIKKLLDANAIEQKKRDFILALFDIDANKKNIEDKANEMKIEVGPDGVKFTGAVLDNLDAFKTLTGKEIQRSPDGSSYAIKMDRNIFSPLYYLDPRQNLLADYRLMMKAAQTSGKDHFTWVLSYSDQDSLMAHARAAYQASIEEGADPKKIKMTDGSGKVIKPEDVFKDNPKKLQQLHQRAQEISNQKNAKGTNQGATKKALNSMKDNSSKPTGTPKMDVNSEDGNNKTPNGPP